MRKLMVPGFIAFTVVLFACDRVASKHDEADPAADAEAVRKVESETMAAFDAKDADKLASYYADDAVLAVPGRDQAEGRAAYLAAMKEDFADPAFNVDFSSDKVEASGDLAYSRGRYTVTFTNPQTKQPETGTGTYVTLFKRQADGGWKIVADVIHAGAAHAPAEGGAGGGNSAATGG